MVYHACIQSFNPQATLTGVWRYCTGGWNIVDIISSLVGVQSEIWVTFRASTMLVLRTNSADLINFGVCSL
eukprot:scaffold191526_cov20-Tisochrysis_lutea.AAC.1